MNFLDTCSMSVLSTEMLEQCRPFSCGDEDLDDFFLNNAENYERQLLGKSYCYRLNNDPSVIVCAFTLSNSSIDARNLPGSRKKKLLENVPREKYLSSYPAVLIGRLGVNIAHAKQGIGSNLLTYIKTMTIDTDNKFACRYLTVDAYNNEATLRYYETNGFKTLFSTEKQEKEHIGLPDDKKLKTRLMYFDLIKLFQ